MKYTETLSIVAGLVLGATSLAADSCRVMRAVTDANGARIELVDADGCTDTQNPATGSLLWVYRNGFAAISQSVAFGPSHLWAGQGLNNERLQSFVLPGDGTPTDFEVEVNSPVGVGSSPMVDRVAILDGIENSGPFAVRGFTSAGATWNFGVPPIWLLSYPQHQIKVSRDGSTVVAGFSYYDQVLAQAFARVYFIDAVTGTEISHWDGPGGITAVSVTDDGSQCLVTNNATGRLIERATGTESFSASASGQGGWYHLSGNGQTIAIGGFDFRVFKKNGAGWDNVINFTAPGQWFSWGIAVSNDGNTVCSESPVSSANYLETYVRAWDVPTAALLGEVHTVGSGGFQDSAFGAAMADDGSSFAVCSWGTADDIHPEVRIFDRTVTAIGGINSTGSPFALAMSPDGRYTASGSKAVHANAMGNGGDVSLFGDAACDADFNGDGVVDFFDYLDFVQAFAANASEADFNADGVIDFFDYLDFVQVFAAGC